MGRPSTFTQKIAGVICEKIADGMSLRKICEAEDMPNKSTVFDWLSKNQAFADQYTRAREVQADSIFDEILDITDDASNDWMEKHNDKGENIGWQVNGEHIQRSRLRVDARKWMAGKLRPKVYGDKIVNELTGPDGGPVRITNDERAEKIQKILDKAKSRGKQKSGN